MIKLQISPSVWLLNFRKHNLSKSTLGFDRTPVVSTLGFDRTPAVSTLGFDRTPAVSTLGFDRTPAMSTADPQKYEEIGNTGTIGVDRGGLGNRIEQNNLFGPKAIMCTIVLKIIIKYKHC